MRILIVTLPFDIHAHAVSWVLRETGHSVQMLYPLDICDSKTWSIDPGENAIEVGSAVDEARSESISCVDVIWNRRVPRIFPIPEIEADDERAAAETEIDHLVTGALQSIESTAFAVNRFGANVLASQKIYQLSQAKQLGFSVPRTVVTNDRGAIQLFMKACGGAIIYKPLKTFVWKAKDRGVSIAHTTHISDLSILDQADFQKSPSIYQEVVERFADVRITVMGRSIFSWSKRPRESVEPDNVDWRVHALGKSINERHEPPKHVIDKCFAMMDFFGLRFGCFDFGLKANGEYVFFEINPGGQFLWGDELGLGLNQLDAFAKFLVSRDPMFEYRPEGEVVTFSDYLAEVDFQSDSEIEAKLHYGDLRHFHYARASVRMAK